MVTQKLNFNKSKNSRLLSKNRSQTVFFWNLKTKGTNVSQAIQSHLIQNPFRIILQRIIVILTDQQQPMIIKQESVFLKHIVPMYLCFDTVGWVAGRESGV